MTVIFPRERVQSENFFIDTRFGVIHEDEEILVIEKPAPLAVHPVGSYFEKNLHTLLTRDPRWLGQKIHFTHRLDAETSGVIVAAKSHDAARFIGIEFLKGRVKKKYHALVFGEPAQQEGQIDFPLGNDASSGFHTVRTLDHENGEKAFTRYRVVWSKGGYSYLEIEPLTGKTHQIRAHLSFIGHPIVGDKIYIDLTIFSRYVVNGLDEAMLQRLKLPRLALHASAISFRHPKKGEEVTFESNAPDFMGEIKF